MDLPFLFARRYLLAKRRSVDRSGQANAINLITLISIVVVAVVTGAMVVVLSTLNGIGELVDSIYSPFDQDLTITPAQGKTILRDSLDVDAVKAAASALNASWVIEENVLLQCSGQQAVATLKAVEPQYLAMSRMPDHMYTGEPVMEGVQGPTALLGLGLKVDLGVPLDDGVLTPLRISAPVRGRKLSTYQRGAFEQAEVAVSGAFSINMEFDMRYMLMPISVAEKLLHYEHEATALEVQLPPNADLDAAADAVRERIGPQWTVRTRYQKNALMYSTNASEKWFTFVVLSFIGLIGGFNIIASLTMMMIEKKADMRTLMALGAPARLVRRIFLYEGVLIVGVGALIGLALGLGLCWLQQRFGLLALSGSVVESYPVKVLAGDIVLVLAAVLVIGVVATAVPLRALSRRFLHAASAA
ncbi:MAG: FtsX-like permease family protein [Flavobacteriales bacterium]|nr:FtsX-like permease family protein [Flavobacteriales bacterium]